MLVARAALAAHEDVLIHAAGSGVSTAALQIARLRGARHILVTAGTAAKLERARRLGATHGIDTLREDFVQVVREITAKKGADVVVDHVGGDTFERSLKALARGGRLVLCGATAGHLVQVNLRPLFFKSQSILGSTMGTIAELRTVLQHVERGDLEPVVDTTFPFERAREAQEYLESRQAFGKVVLTMGEG
jgi:NADPH:quinone reductase-like Zn-dependent oxidoreductase